MKQEVEIKRVAYSYNSNLEGQEPYTLDVFVFAGREVVVDMHRAFQSRASFLEAIEEVIPVLTSDGALIEGDGGDD